MTDPLVASRYTSDKIHLPASTFGRVTTKTRQKAAERGEAMPDGCLSGDTLIATLSGAQRIDALLGSQKLLTEYGWVDGEVRCFGTQRLYSMTFTRDGEKHVVFSTAGHRWLLSNGSWTTTSQLLAEVPRDGVKPDCLSPSESCIASLTEKTANASSCVAVIDMKRRPFAHAVSALASSCGNALAQKAATALIADHAFKISRLESVLYKERVIATGEPLLITNDNGIDLATASSSIDDTALTVSSIALIPGVELSVRFGFSTSSTNDISDVVDGKTFGVLPLLHTANRTKDWKLVEISNTDRVEPVYCAVVPGLHRFALANGMITGNSFPIRDKKDLQRAIQAFGRAKDKAAVKRHIVRRARGLGSVDLLPKAWREAAAQEFSHTRQAANSDALTAASRSSIVSKLERHNARASEDQRVCEAQLRVVYRRGLSDYSSCQALGPEQAAQARVNSFLRLMRNGTPDASDYTEDNDLLPASHPLARADTLD